MSNERFDSTILCVISAFQVRKETLRSSSCIRASRRFNISAKTTKEISVAPENAVPNLDRLEKSHQGHCAAPHVWPVCAGPVDGRSGVDVAGSLAVLAFPHMVCRRRQAIHQSVICRAVARLHRCGAATSAPGARASRIIAFRATRALVYLHRKTRTNRRRHASRHVNRHEGPR